MPPTALNLALHPSSALQSGNSDNTVRCPSGTCLGKDGCTPSCGDKGCCSAVEVDCKKGSISGRTCGKKCDEDDKYYGEKLSRAGKYPTCPGGEHEDPK